MYVIAVLHYPSEAMRVERILELPELVTGEVGADEELASPWQAQSLPSEPELLDETGFGRHLCLSRHGGI